MNGKPPPEIPNVIADNIVAQLVIVQTTEGQVGARFPGDSVNGPNIFLSLGLLSAGLNLLAGLVKQALESKLEPPIIIPVHSLPPGYNN
jgi:hypothetical protein